MHIMLIRAERFKYQYFMSSGNKKTEKKISIAGKIKSAIIKSSFGRDMRAPLAVLVASGFLLMIFVCIYLFKEIVATLPDVADPDNVIDLGTASGNTYADLEWYMSYTDYMREYGVNIAITQELTENEDGEIEVIEVIDLGDVGIAVGVRNMILLGWSSQYYRGRITGSSLTCRYAAACGRSPVSFVPNFYFINNNF